MPGGICPVKNAFSYSTTNSFHMCLLNTLLIVISSFTITESYYAFYGTSTCLTSPGLFHSKTLLSKFNHGDDATAPASTSTFTSTHHQQQLHPYSGDIVGSNGRIGSFLLRQSNFTLNPIQRGEPIGRMTWSNNCSTSYTTRSSKSMPIYIATPASAIPYILQSTPRKRWNDLVFVCNGMVSNYFLPDNQNDYNGTTIAVLHFAVLKKHGIAVGDKVPSILYGRHAMHLSKLLQTQQLPVTIVHCVEDINIAAAKKLLWASLFWLLTQLQYDDGNSSSTSIICRRYEQCSVAEVHRNVPDLLLALVTELMPAIRVIATSNLTASTASRRSIVRKGDDKIGTIDSIMEYLKAYSESIAFAKPSYDLGLREYKERNGLLLSVESIVDQQHLHKNILRCVLGEKEFQSLSTK